MKIERASQTPETKPEETNQNPLAGEMADVYVAMLVVVPLAFLLRALWP